MKRIFCDGVFDLLHEGHIKHFQYLKGLYQDVHLLIGVMDDDEATHYKRKPFHNMTHRAEMVASCKYVDEIIEHYPYIMNKEFMDTHNIDIVAHAFSDENDIEKQLQFFIEPIKQNKFMVVPYNYGISTTNITESIETGDWKNVWNTKGTEKLDLEKLSGYEDTSFDRDSTIINIIDKLDIHSNDKVLEIGCSAGYIAEKLYEKCNYYGIDYSRSLINAHHKFMPNNKILCCEADNLPFKDNYFDKILCNSVFEYFPDHDYANKVIKEMKRVSKSIIYITNVRHTTRETPIGKHKYDGIFKHTIYKPTDSPFSTFTIAEPTFQHDKRFSAVYTH
jgi:cytidyltransferase-like protein